MSIGDVLFYNAASIAAASSMLLIGQSQIAAPTEVTSEFFEVHSIQAERVGDTAVLFVDREIHAPITQSFTVRVMELQDGQWSQFCQMESEPIEYRPNVALVDKASPIAGGVSLDWWTYGKCATLPEGQAQVWTTWTPQAFGLYPVSYVFDVAAK